MPIYPFLTALASIERLHYKMQKSRKLSKHAEAHFNLLRINLGKVELNKIKIKENSAKLAEKVQKS